MFSGEMGTRKRNSFYSKGSPDNIIFSSSLLAFAITLFPALTPKRAIEGIILHTKSPREIGRNDEVIDISTPKGSNLAERITMGENPVSKHEVVKAEMQDSQKLHRPEPPTCEEYVTFAFKYGAFHVVEK